MRSLLDDYYDDENGEDVAKDNNTDGKQSGKRDGTVSTFQRNARSSSNEFEEIFV